jgi:hypothetical protein
VPVGDVAGQEPSVHDAGLSFIASSIEIGARRANGLKFITHLDIIRNASQDAQEAQSPLSIPIPELAHTLGSGKHVTLKDVHLEPDALFGIQYPPKDDPNFRFFALEYDRGTEDVEPSGNLGRASWLRKVLSYSAISAHQSPIYQTYLRVPELLVLCIFSDPSRMTHVMELVTRHATQPNQFLFKTVSPVDPLTCTTPMPQFFTESWRRVKGVFNVGTYDEGR